MTDLDAIMTIEGDDEDADEARTIEAWQQLINSGAVWHLQGFYGRTASRLIDAGLCHERKAA